MNNTVEASVDLRDWDTRFLDLAEHISKWSKDPSTKVGAVIVDSQRRIVSTGYNGFSVGVMDSYDRLTDRDTKYEMIIHAEANAILFAHQRMNDMTLYTTPFQPCSRCASLIIQSGISRVISYEIEESRTIVIYQFDAFWFREHAIPRYSNYGGN